MKDLDLAQELYTDKLKEEVYDVMYEADNDEHGPTPVAGELICYDTYDVFEDIE